MQIIWQMLCTDTVAHRSAFARTNVGTNISTNTLTNTADIFAHAEPYDSTVCSAIPCAHRDADSADSLAHICAIT